MATAIMYNMLIKANNPLPQDETVLQTVPVLPVEQTKNVV